MYYVYIIAHLYGCDSYNLMFNAYKRYKVLIHVNVKDEDSAITISTEIGLSGYYQLNSILLLNTKNTCILSL